MRPLKKNFLWPLFKDHSPSEPILEKLFHGAAFKAKTREIRAGKPFILRLKRHKSAYDGALPFVKLRSLRAFPMMRLEIYLAFLVPENFRFRPQISVANLA
jgi:hypothetical protein